MGKGKQITVEDVQFYNMKTVVDENGNLTPIESNEALPFSIERVFYVYGVRSEELRGCHAHHNTQQLLICLNGKIQVICKDGEKERQFLLESPQQALYIPNMIWDEQLYRSEDSVLLSVCSTKYNSTDYIHCFEEFKELKGIKE
tara:strand:+ start:240 stop:671 length:432 start_codon:yes stop_codon:yes gene_type:complete